MIVYRIRTLPLIKNIKREILDATQTCYAGDAGALGMFERLETYFYSVTRQGLGRGYHPESTKSVLIVRRENLEAGKLFGACHGFRVCTGALYLGGYIWDDESKHDWLRERTNINTIRKNEGKYT